jgi:NAD(P) transhydrogenase subunit alpha
MQYLGVLREDNGSKIVAITPEGVGKLRKSFNILVENGAGEKAGFSDDMYVAAGAEIYHSRSGLVKNSDILVSFESKLKAIKSDKKKVFIGFFNVLNDSSIMLPFTNSYLDVYSLDLIPRTTLAQPMDVISSVASITGYQAVLLAAEISPIVVPMVTGAGGTLRPAKILILGAGVAGLQAIATAKRLGALVKAFDVRSSTKNEVESLGATFIKIEGAAENKEAGGYAIEQSEDYLKLIDQKIAEEAIDADIIITTAKIPGKKSPTLLSKTTVDKMKRGAVIIDLAAENGGNCELTTKNEITEYKGVQIVGFISLLNRCANSISSLISNNFSSFLNYYINHLEDEGENEILRATKVVADGKIINPKIINEVTVL